MFISIHMHIYIDMSAVHIHMHLQILHVHVFILYEFLNLSTLRYTKKHPFAASLKDSGQKIYTFCLNAKSYILLRYDKNTSCFHVQ